MTARLDPALIPAKPDLILEAFLWDAGIEIVAGLDEAGRGAWAGPVAAAAVVFPANMQPTSALAEVRDSKQLTPGQRSGLAQIIKTIALGWGVGFATSLEIDEIGILPATRLAMTRALEVVQQSVEHLLIDALFLPESLVPQTALIKGDQRSLSIAAASILAKTERDAWMRAYAIEQPHFGFEYHKGYGTWLHRHALDRYGTCPQHRRTFRPIAEQLQKTGAE